MPLCTNGTEPASGAPAYFWLNRATWESIFPDSLDWLAPLLTMAAPDRLYETAIFCALEPPEPVDFDITDIPRHITDVLQIGPFALKLQQWAEARLWHEYCRCSPVAVTNAACGYTYGPATHQRAMGQDYSWDILPATSNVGDTGHFEFTGIGFAAGTQARIRAYAYPGPTTVLDVLYSIGNGAKSYDLVLGAGKTHIGGHIFPVNGSTQIDIYNLEGDTIASGCSPVPTEWPDPGQPAAPSELPTYVYPACNEEDLCARLNDLDLRLGIVNGYVQLIQRQAVPFASVPGASHPGLTGSGSFAVQGILALSVNITTLPSAYGQLLANPTVLFDVGWIAIGMANGWLPAHRLQHDPMLLFPPLGGMITQVAYYLRPGVVVTILELERET